MSKNIEALKIKNISVDNNDDDVVDTNADNVFNIKKNVSMIRKIRDEIQNYNDKATDFYDLAGKASNIYMAEKEIQTKGFGCEFAILWSNVQTLRPALFGQLPKINISKRHKNVNQMSALALQIAEQVADYIADNAFLKQAIMEAVNARLVLGRGQIWFAYRADIQGDMVNDEKITVEYVPYKDFGHSVVGQWSDVSRVWRKVYLTKSEAESFFDDNKRILDKLNFSDDADISEGDLDDADKKKKDSACVYEVWCKDTKAVYFIDKSLGHILLKKPVATELTNFFPCPKPLYATKAENSLFPKPDYFFYEPQAHLLEKLAEKQRTVLEMIKSVGLYDSSKGSIQDLLTSEHGTMLPLGDDTILAEGGVASLFTMLDITQYANMLSVINNAIDVTKSAIYEITGIADIIRGQGQSNVTATTDGIKAKFATLRLSEMQDNVQEFIHDAYMIMVEMGLLCLTPDALDKIVEIEEINRLKTDNPEQIEALMAFIKNIKDFNFKIDIETDSTVKINQDADKADRMEFVNMFSTLMGQAIQAPKELLPLTANVLKFAVASFRGGRELENEINNAIDNLVKASAVPAPPKPDPEIQKQNFELEKQQRQQDFDLRVKSLELQNRVTIEKIRAEVRLNDTGRSTYGQPV